MSPRIHMSIENPHAFPKTHNRMRAALAGCMSCWKGKGVQERRKERCTQGARSTRVWTIEQLSLNAWPITLVKPFETTHVS